MSLYRVASNEISYIEHNIRISTRREKERPGSVGKTLARFARSAGSNLAAFKFFMFFMFF